MATDRRELGRAPQAQDQPSGIPAFWARSAEEVLADLHASPDGLSSAEAAGRLGQYGANRLAPARRGGAGHLLLRQFTQPLVLILIAATVLSMVLGDRVDAMIILAIIVLSGLLGFWQERGAAVAVARLLDRVKVEVEVRRDGRAVSISPEDVVPGDILVLNAGDLIPCDSRVLRAESLQTDEAALTGETFPVSKSPQPVAADTELSERDDVLFQGSHVVSGRGEAVAVVTGAATELGQVSQELEVSRPRTGFEQGSARFGLLLARVTGVLTAVILVVNVALGRPALDAVLFSLALAIGVSPQMLPAIVAVSLSSGARRLARAKVIVRRLDAIEDLGSMNVLCTDKTGTLTQGAIDLRAAVDSTGRPSALVLARAVTNAGLQTGYVNPLDTAVLARESVDPGWRAIDEVPFDFTRKRLSVLAEGPDGRRLLICKGAYASVVAQCATTATPDGSAPPPGWREGLDSRFGELSSDGSRVLAVAERELSGAQSVTAEQERDLTFLGFLVFSDPPKPGLARTVAELGGLGIRLCMLTGDNHVTARHVAGVLGLDTTAVLTGAEVEALSDADLVLAARRVCVFAETTPLHKERVIEALRSGGAVVGYLGDGINDAAPLHLADVGISVDTAVDVAKSAAAVVLLEKDLEVIVQGVRLGRETFANTLKYVFTTISANFGNTLSMAAASAFLDFLPLLPRQILLLNFLSDLPSTTIAADSVDPEQVAEPRRWDLRYVRDFMVVFGLLSTGFDLLTFAMLLQVFHADAALFRTAWFVESALTELAVLFVLRTRRPVYRSRPGRLLLVSSVAVAAVTVALPFLPHLGGAFALIPLPGTVVAALVAVTLCYVLAAEITKRRFFRAVHETAPQEWPAEFPDAARQQRRLARLAHEHGRPAGRSS